MEQYKQVQVAAVGTGAYDNMIMRTAKFVDGCPPIRILLLLLWARKRRKAKLN